VPRFGRKTKRIVGKQRPGTGPACSVQKQRKLRRYFSAAVFMPKVTVAWNTTALPVK
jgi:hypothetical protein